MSRRILHAISIIILISFLPTFSAADTPLAVLLSCQGDVFIIQSGGSSIKGTFGVSLAAGDEVRTGTDSRAEILFENGNCIQVGANSSMQIKGSRAEAVEKTTDMGKKSFETVSNFLKIKDSEGTSSLVALRGTDKATELHAVSPSHTKIRRGKPTFEWSSSDPSMEVQLTIYNEEGIHWQTKVEGVKKLEYPEDAPSLTEGMTYSWTLETTDPLLFPPLRSQAVYFEVLSQEENKTLEAALSQINREESPSESTYHLVRASLFFNYGLLENAIDETLMALEIDSKNTTLHAILARLYTKVGRTDKALGEYDRILEQQ